MDGDAGGDMAGPEAGDGDSGGMPNTQAQGALLAAITQLGAVNKIRKRRHVDPVEALSKKIATIYPKNRLNEKVEIVDIDTANQLFDVDILLECKWIDPYLGQLTDEELKILPIELAWKPKIRAVNTLTTASDKSWGRFEREARNAVAVTMMKRTRGKYFEEMELQQFPLDTQEITVQLTVDQPLTEVELMENPYSISVVNRRSFKDATEWRLFEHVDVTSSTYIDEYGEDQAERSQLSFTCRVARRVGYFGWNIWFVMFLILLMTFIAYSIEPTGHQSRISLTWTLLLTAVAFKMVANRSLPQISYLTYLDKYIIVAIVFLCIQGAQNALAGIVAKRLNDIEAAHNFDMYCLIVMAVVISIYHIVFFVYVYCTAYRRRYSMEDRDELYRERKAQLKTLVDTKDPLSLTLETSASDTQLLRGHMVGFLPTINNGASKDQQQSHGGTGFLLNSLKRGSRVEPKK